MSSDRKKGKEKRKKNLPVEPTGPFEDDPPDYNKFQQSYEVIPHRGSAQFIGESRLEGGKIERKEGEKKKENEPGAEHFPPYLLLVQSSERHCRLDLMSVPPNAATGEGRKKGKGRGGEKGAG